MNILRLRRFLRLTPFDASTEQGRADERYRLAFLSIAANVVSRGVAMVVMVLTVSLTIPYLGAERFGVWMTIASFVGMLSFLDLGIGNALTNKVSQAAALNNPDALRSIVSGGLGFLFILGCIIGLLLYGLTNVLPWHKIIKVKDSAVTIEVINTTAIFSILFGFSLFTNGMQRIFAGLQRAFEAHFINLAGSCFSLFALWIATKQEASIPYLLAATLGVQSLANIGLLFVLVKRSLFTLRGISVHIRLQANHLLRVGGLFFVLQIGTMVSFGADSLIIASSLGATQVAAFAIAQRLFQFVTQPMAIINAPLWGAYADAHERGEKKFIRSTLKRSLLTTCFISILGAVVIIVTGEYLVERWTGNAVSISLILLVAYGTWAILDAIGNALAMFLNGCSIVKPQVFTVVIFSICALTAKYILVNNFGISAMIIGQALIYLLITSLSYGVIFRAKLIKIYT